MKEMELGLGIDTGGTFTDAAVLNLASTEVVAKAKSPTTYHDLSIGITSALDGVLASGRFDVADIVIVGLSTTLATNSILQGKGGKVGLIGIGWEPDPEWHLGHDMARFVKGGHDVMGKETEPLDEAAIEEAIIDMIEMEAVAISSLFSICNPEHEARAREIVQKHANMPVVTGHELTSELGIVERTATAVLNARLLPVISDFLRAIETAIRSRSIGADIMVVKGDGSLMSLDAARERPVETILSGPAASLMGGKTLAKSSNCWVIDMGGTSTDIAYLDDGFPRLNNEGASVGRWRTRVRAIDIWTCGLGGDSDIQTDCSGRTSLGPERALPLAIAAQSIPGLRERMLASGMSAFYVAFPKDGVNLPEAERAVLGFLKASGPATLDEIENGLPELYFVADNLRSLGSRSLVIRTGLTPTDILHVKGIYAPGSIETAWEGVRQQAARAHLTPRRFAEGVFNQVVTLMGKELLKKVLTDEAGPIPKSEVIDYVLAATVGESSKQAMKIRVSLDRPIVAIGAPAHVFAPLLEKSLDIHVLVPENHDVGNAVGAVSSQVTECVDLQVYPRDHKYHILSSFSAPLTFEHQDEAVEKARDLAIDHVKNRVRAMGASDIRVKVDVEERKFVGGYVSAGPLTNWIEVRARATGTPGIRPGRE